MPTNGRQPAKERRSALLETALDLFSRLGYHATTTRAIAENSGVTEAVLFKHFRSKQDLLREVLQVYGPRQLATVDHAEMSALPLREALRRGILFYIDSFWEHRACIRLMIMETWRDPVLLADLQDHSADRRRGLENFLVERGSQDLVHREMSRAVANVITSATTGFLITSLRAEPPDWNAACAAFVDEMLDVALASLENARLPTNESNKTTCR